MLIARDKREELEVLFMRVVIKPIETWQAKKTIPTLAKNKAPDQVDPSTKEIDENFLSEIVERPDLKLD